jgi:hypothetical protein
MCLLSQLAAPLSTMMSCLLSGSFLELLTCSSVSSGHMRRVVAWVVPGAGAWEAWAMAGRW